MTVKQFREELSKYPDNMDVFVAERKTEFRYGLVNSIQSKEIKFYSDDRDNGTYAKDTVVVIDEE